MGIFDGILLASDWDGTICMGKYISEQDINAVRYFQENGGLFTICSGRFLPYLEDFFDKIKPNTSAICLNGALIIDPNTKERLFEGALDDDAIDVIGAVMSSDKSFFSITLYPFGVEEWIRLTRDEFFERIPELSNQKYHKCIIISKTPDAIPKAKLATLNYNDRYSIVSSWSDSIEILSHECTKGKAVLKLKSMTASRLLVAIGDYENDVSMLCAADISLAPCGACEAAKEAADIVLDSPCGCAIAEVVERIKNSLS